MNEILAALGAKSLGGLGGGILSLRFFDGLSTLGKCGTAASGLACAYFLTPLVILWLGLGQTVATEGGIGFLVGLYGMSCASAVMQGIRSTDWAAVIRGRLGQ